MAQTGYTPIILFHSTTASAVPTTSNLAVGELGLNNTDGKLYYNTGSAIAVLAGAGGAGIAGGSNTQVQYNSSGSLAGSANMTFNGTTLTLANDASISGLTVGKGGGSQSDNVVLGSGALANGSNTGNYNVALGSATLGVNTSGAQSFGGGWRSLWSNTTGSYNVALGHQSMYLNTTGSNNTALGFTAMQSNTTGGSNTAVGYNALQSNTTASNNTAVGYQAGYSNTTGNLTAIGKGALYSNTTGAGNTAVGDLNPLYFNTTGNFNVALGNQGLTSNTTGSNNTALGYQTLVYNTTASNNTAVGYQAGYSNTTGTQTTVFGAFAGYSNTTANYNTFIGQNAGYFTTGGSNTFIGQRSTGSGAGQYVTTGTKNTIIGGYDGNLGGLDIRTSSNYIVLSDGDGNPRFYLDGSGFGYLNTVTKRGLGQLSIDYAGNVAAGMGINDSTSTGGSSFINFQTGGTNRGSISNSGNTAVSYNTTSDYRLKENVAPMTGALATVAQLKPVTYDWISDKSKGQGFIAHELQAIVPDCVTGEKDAVDAEGKPVYQGIDTSFLVATLTAAIQELSTQVTTLQAQVTALQGK
jgi:hypothetical protein